MERNHLTIIQGGSVALLSPDQQQSIALRLRKIYADDVSTNAQKKRLVKRVVNHEITAVSTPQAAIKSFQKLLRTISEDVLKLEQTQAELPVGCLEWARPLIGSTLEILSRLHDSPENNSDPDDAGPR